MDQHTISLIDILTPPANRWLKGLSRRKENLPVGVRVVRFSDGDDDDVAAPRRTASAVGAPRMQFESKP